MKVVWNFLAWPLACALILFPIIYSFTHWGTAAFRDNAVGNWLGTIIGVIVGVPIALQVSRAQQHSQERAKKDRQHRERQDEAKSLRLKVSEELRHNLETVERLRQVLQTSRGARTDVWQWAEKIVRSVEFSAWHSLDSVVSPNHNYLGDSPEYIAYRNLKRLVSRVQEALSAHNFFDKGRYHT